MNDLISRRAAIDALNRHLDTIPVVNNNTMEMIRRSEAMDCREIINGLPSAQPEKKIFKNMSDGEFEKWLYEHGIFHPDINESIPCDAVPYLIDCAINELPSAQPELIARDIATIIENEQDMRVILKNAEHTETHSCDYERTGTHDWIPVTERQPNHELAIVQFSDGDFSLLQFPTAYRWKDIVAWFPLPEPYKEGQE